MFSNATGKQYHWHSATRFGGAVWATAQTTVVVGPGAVTAYANTWALGQLRPGQTAKFDFSVTAVKPGRHVVAWEVAAGLNGKAKAVLQDGSLPHGKFTVLIHNAPAQTYVNNNGQIVTTSSSNPQ